MFGVAGAKTSFAEETLGKAPAGGGGGAGGFVLQGEESKLAGEAVCLAFEGVTFYRLELHTWGGLWRCWLSKQCPVTGDPFQVGPIDFAYAPLAKI